MPDPATLRGQLLDLLGTIAPEADLDSLPPQGALREELDLDSLDFLGFVSGIAERLGIEVPERDYGHLDTLESTVEYLSGRTTPA